MLEYTETDIILASETWLQPGITEREILPPDFRFVARKDRLKDAHDGVAIIAGSDMDGVEIDVQTSTEFVASSFPCNSPKKPLIVGSLYRPPKNEEGFTEELCQAIKDLSTRHSQSTIWIGGDANLPDIDSSNSSITGNNYSIPINTAFVNVVHDICAEQVVTFPTRLENTLDISITNRPTLVSKCTSIPGLSDHHIVLTDANVIPLRQKPPKKADIIGMEEDFQQFSETFTSEFSVDTPINCIWTSFKSKSL